MSAGLIATKVGMSRVFQDNGNAVAVTYLKVEPNTVVRCKTEEKDGYNAVVLGVGSKQWESRKGKKNISYKTQKEWQVESCDGFTPGMQLTAAVIPAESTVTVCGMSKGKGFQGVIKRHNFKSGPDTHGSHHHRRPGSVGMCEYPGHILKGKRMAGRMGNSQITISGRPVLVTDPENGLIGIQGAIPGPNGGMVFLTFEFEPEFSGTDADEVVEETAATDASKEAEEAIESKETNQAEESDTQETESEESSASSKEESNSQDPK